MSLLASGFAAALGQIVLLRELGTAWSGQELLYVLGLAIWLATAALGTATAGRLPAVGPAAGCVALSLLLPAGLVAARALRPLLVAGQDLEPGLGNLFLGVVLVVGPGAWLSGLLAQRAHTGTTPRRIDRLALGAAAGGVTAGLLPALGLPAAWGILAASLSLLAVARPADRRWRWAPLALAAVLVAAGPRMGALDRALSAWSDPDLALVRETPRGRLTLTSGRDGGVVIRLDGALVHRRADADDDLVHVAATQHPRPRSAAVLGGWLDGAPQRLADHGLERIVALEPDGEVLRLADGPQPDSGAGLDLVVAEPRAWLDAAPERFDLILGALPEPLNVGANRFWTRQFAALCARRLQDGGILALQMRTGEQVWTLPQARRIAAIHRALAEVFAEVRVLPGAVTIMIAANRPLESNPDRLAARLPAGDPAAHQEAADMLRRRWHGHRTAEAAGILAAAAVPANTDLRPVCLADPLLHDLGRLFPGLGWRELPQPRRWLTPGIVGGALLALWLRRRRGAALALVTGYAGLAHAVLVCALLLYHQTQHGTLYRDLGFLLALGHLGRAASAWLTVWSRPVGGRWRLPVLLIVLSLWSFVVTVRILLGSGTAAVAVWLLGAGLLASLVTTACERRAETTPAAQARLLAARLGGAGAGALLAAMLLMPFSGLPATTLTVTVLAFPAALAVWPLPGQASLDAAGDGGRR